MVWMIKALMDNVATILIVVGGIVAQTQREYGTIIAAIGVAIKAMSEYLYEQGIIARFGKK